MPELLTFAAQGGKPALKLMPWVMKNPRKTASQATPDEVATATAELEGGIVFA